MSNTTATVNAYTLSTTAGDVDTFTAKAKALVAAKRYAGRDEMVKVTATDGTVIFEHTPAATDAPAKPLNLRDSKKAAKKATAEKVEKDPTPATPATPAKTATAKKAEPKAPRTVKEGWHGSSKARVEAQAEKNGWTVEDSDDEASITVSKGDHEITVTFFAGGLGKVKSGETGDGQSFTRASQVHAFIRPDVDAGDAKA